MITSKTIHSFKLSVQEGHTVLATQEYPWSVLQVVPTTPEEFDSTKEVLAKRGYVAHRYRPHLFHYPHRKRRLRRQAPGTLCAYHAGEL